MARNDKFFEEVIRYSQTNQGKRLQQFLRGMGSIGRLIADMVDTTGRRNTAREVEDAIGLLRESGFDVTPTLRGPIHAPPRQTQVRQVPTVPTATPREDTWPEERSIASPARTWSTGLDEGDMVWHQTPESSNVYAFAYDFTQRILYVQYKDNGPATSARRGVNSCTGKEYTYHSRPHAPGPVYSYGSRAQPIPEALYYAMRSAASKGRFVWQNLRVCGSHHAHQVPYQLASVPQSGGKPYVPRKAIAPQSVTIHDEQGNAYDTVTTDRFRVRTVPEVGTGRRRAFPSTIRRTV